MKKVLTVVIALAIVTPLIFTGCKKGENDPFLSLKSRTARLSNTWKCTEMTTTNTTTQEYGGSTYTSTSTSTYSGTSLITSTSTSSGGTTTTTGDTTDVYTLEVTFDKSGTYTQTEFEKNESTGYTYEKTTVTKGIWYWNGKNKDEEIKSKEMVVMETTEITETESTTVGGVTTTDTDTDRYTGSSSMVTRAKLDQLSGSTLVYKSEGSYDNVDTDSPYTSSTTSTVTFEKQ